MYIYIYIIYIYIHTYCLFIVYKYIYIYICIYIYIYIVYVLLISLLVVIFHSGLSESGSRCLRLAVQKLPWPLSCTLPYLWAYNDLVLICSALQPRPRRQQNHLSEHNFGASWPSVLLVVALYGQFSKFHVCFCGLDPGNLKFETVRTHKQHICF